MLAPACTATVDLSNVDLQNFRFFKYPHHPQTNTAGTAANVPPLPVRYLMMLRPNGNNSPGRRPQLIVVRTIVRPQSEQQQPSAGPLSKVRAIVGYVSGVLFGNLANEPEIPVLFHPDAAYRLREQYQRQFGYRGEQLIEQLGRGGGVGSRNRIRVQGGRQGYVGG